jgi:hypothetical protein
MPPISTFRVFLSSPGDVKAEREAAERVVRRIGGIYAAHVEIILERWEGKFYQATASFQEQIEATSAFDLVVVILWKRIGTELPSDHFRRPNGAAFESGTVLEIESALEASVKHGGKPAVFVFRKKGVSPCSCSGWLVLLESERRGDAIESAALHLGDRANATGGRNAQSTASKRSSGGTDYKPECTGTRSIRMEPFLALLPS